MQTFLRSGFSALYCVTHEEDRTTNTIMKQCDEIGFSVWQWTATHGLIDPKGMNLEKFGDKKTSDPAIALLAFLEVTVGKGQAPEGKHIKNKSVLILKDFHIPLKKVDVVMYRLVKDCINIGRVTARSIIVMGCQLQLPPELEKEFTTIEFPLPSKEELQEIAAGLAKDKGTKISSYEPIVDAGAGMTTQEFADAAAASLTDHNTIDAAFISEMKSQAIKKGGLLEIIKPGVSFDNLGGMHDLKSWIIKRKGAFSKKAREYGLPPSKGVIMLGVQGGGKSVATRAIASELDVPLIRLDIGRLFGGLVGASEENVRRAIAQVEAFGPSVLQIDEIDKGAAGMVGSSGGDSGTSRRVLGTLLTWLSEKTSPVFVVATANDVSQLPPELLRKGRWDEMFFIDLPNAEERKEIWSVQIKLKGRDPKKFNHEPLVASTEGWTGAEIEALFIESMYAAFADNKEPTTELLVELSANTVPLSKMMAEQIAGLRQWADGRCRMATAKKEQSAVVKNTRTRLLT